MYRNFFLQLLLETFYNRNHTVQVRKLVDRELQEPLFDVFLWGVLFKYKTKF